MPAAPPKGNATAAATPELSNVATTRGRAVDRIRNANRLTVLAWAVFAVLALLALSRPATHDFRDEPLAGDEASHLLQALSIAHDSHTLNFDRRDVERWQSLGWATQPVGLFFQRHDDDLYGVAKPYGYSLYLAPFIAVFGAVHGVAIGNTLLLALLMGISALLLLTRYRGPVVPLAVGSFFLAASPYMYAYWNHTELFLALLVLVAFAAAVRFAQTGGAAWALLSFAAMGFGMSEKAAFIALFAPIGLVMLWKARHWWLRAAMPAVAIAVFAVAIIPYLYYSDGASFTPYGGDHRLYVSHGTPFAGDTEGFASTSFEATNLVEDVRGISVTETLESVTYYAVGRHTGLLVYMPLALLLIIAGLARFRSTDAWGKAAVVSVVGYVAFYVVVFPTNYFGGGHALGNRYFLQAAPAVLALVVLAGVSRRILLGTSLAGVVIGVAMLLPHHREPESAHVHIERTSSLQRLLPVESNQTELPYVTCDRQAVTHVAACR